eukprot:2605857-Prorocentrum_lima.AAC.1
MPHGRGWRSATLTRETEEPGPRCGGGVRRPAEMALPLHDMTCPKKSKRGENRNQAFQFPARPVSVQKSYTAIAS